MKNSIGLASALLIGLLAAPGSAQPAPSPATPVERQDALDPSPVDPAGDPDSGLFVNDWRTAAPRTAFGQLVFRDILTPLDSADPLRPHKRGAVLTQIGAVSRATLAPGASGAGRMPAGQRAIFYTTQGEGALLVNGRSTKLKDGVGFVLTPDFDFRLTAIGKTPLGFYVRTEALPPGTAATPDPVVVSRWDNDRRIGAHWVHICNGGPPGMMLCTIAPNTMPQPHSHNYEELWLLVKGESVLMLGKQLIRMQPGQAYKIPPSGLVAHSNLNLGAEPIQMLYMGPAVRGPRMPLPDFAQLQNTPIEPATAPDIDMFMGNWRDAYPRIAHGNLYMRDLLTDLAGSDPTAPTRKGAVLVAGQTISQAMLEPGATAHPVEGAPKDRQEIFIVMSGTGQLAIDGHTSTLSAGQSFIIGPDRDFRLTATGSEYLSFYVVTETLSGPATATGQVLDRRAAPTMITAWHNAQRPLLTTADGLQHYAAISEVVLKPMAMSRPSSVASGGEDIWIALDDVDLLLGKQLRTLRAGTAYKVPPTGISANANINLAARPARFLHISTAR